MGDNVRKGAVKKRSQLKTTLGGATAWTKRNKKGGEFMAVKKPHQAEKIRQEIQGRTARAAGKRLAAMSERLRSICVVFACPKCGQAYGATQQHFPYERPGRFDCVACNGPVHAWRGFFDFTDWKALRLPEQADSIARHRGTWGRQVFQGSFEDD
jgi:hypothetical protein